jgi:hypothetical protein
MDIAFSIYKVRICSLLQNFPAHLKLCGGTTEERSCSMNEDHLMGLFMSCHISHSSADWRYYCLSKLLRPLLGPAVGPRVALAEERLKVDIIAQQRLGIT